MNHIALDLKQSIIEIAETSLTKIQKRFSTESKIIDKQIGYIGTGRISGKEVCDALNQVSQEHNIPMYELFIDDEGWISAEIKTPYSDKEKAEKIRSLFNKTNYFSLYL